MDYLPWQLVSDDPIWSDPLVPCDINLAIGTVQILWVINSLSLTLSAPLETRFQGLTATPQLQTFSSIQTTRDVPRIALDLLG